MPEHKTGEMCGIEVAMSTTQINRREMIQTLDGLKARILDEEPGCGCEFFEDLGTPNRFLWKEWWPTKEAAENARSSDRFRALVGAVKILGSLESIRNVREQSSGGRESGTIRQTENNA
jgi:quinol monooxygenase YgiN